LVLTRRERIALVRAVHQLSAEVSNTPPEVNPVEPVSDEELVLAVRRGLERIVISLVDGIDHEHGNRQVAIAAALDGAEAVMRGEMALRNHARLPSLLPAFVFLVSLPVSDHERALELSKRCSQLLRES
jgi:hypothetical protein